MRGEPIREQLGRVIEAFTVCARADPASVADLGKNEFFHVAGPVLRRRASEVFHSQEWASVESKNQQQLDGLWQAVRADADRLIPQIIARTRRQFLLPLR